VDDPTERWLPVIGYEGLYEVSDLGRVRGARNTSRADWRRIRKFQLDSSGYPFVTLHRDGKVTSLRVHRLVMRAFVGPCPPGQQVRHGPEGRQDNRLASLSYGTPKEDREDMVRDGTRPYGEAKTLAKLTDAAVQEIRRRYEAGEGSQAGLAREYGVCRGTIENVVTGKTWRHV
jgi:hypothetical protein